MRRIKKNVIDGLPTGANKKYNIVAKNQITPLSLFHAFSQYIIYQTTDRITAPGSDGAGSRH
jgi:hypothetical protein